MYSDERCDDRTLGCTGVRWRTANGERMPFNFAASQAFVTRAKGIGCSQLERGAVAARAAFHGFLDFWQRVLVHSRMAEELGEFAFADVAEAICDKMIRRHPHVFGEASHRDAAEQTVAWEAIKAQERAARDATQSLLDGVPSALPALTRAEKLTRRAARVGFTWTTPEAVIEKLHEELGELAVEVAAGDRAKMRDEMGDVLFVCANLARLLEIDPEDALRSTNAKFARRFNWIEQALAADGRTPEESDLDEMDELWNAAKRDEKG